MRLTCSNMPWCRIRPTALFSASADVGCTLALRKSWKPNSRKSPRASRSCWHVTIPKPVQSKGRPGFGGRRDSDRWSAQLCTKPRSSSRVRFRRSLPYPALPASRRQEIMFQVAFRHVLAHLKGYAAPETKAAVERTRQLIEQAESRGEAPEDPMLLFSLLNSLWTGSIVAFNGEEACGLADEFLARAERQHAAAPIVNGYRLVGTSLLMTGDIVNGQSAFQSRNCAL